MTVNDKAVLITGASSGIGAELARQMAEKGAHLMLSARRKEALESTASACRAFGAMAYVHEADLTDPLACRDLIETTVSRLGGLDILVNNAGRSMWARLDEITDPSVFEELIRVNYLGTAYCTWHALPYLKQRAGLIVGISSLTGKTGVPTRSAYSASKHAVQGFLDSVRIEVRPYGIDVLIASPGFVATHIRAKAMAGDGSRIGPRGDVGNQDAMPVQVCAARIIGAIERRQRELFFSWRDKLGMWLKLVLPRLVDLAAERQTRQYAPRQVEDVTRSGNTLDD